MLILDALRRRCRRRRRRVDRVDVGCLAARPAQPAAAVAGHALVAVCGSARAGGRGRRLALACSHISVLKQMDPLDER